ncbi:MAG: transposase [Minisyncoccia bacterium]
MKLRDYKDVGDGSIFHAYNRGNNKEKIFFDQQDYRAFLFRLGLILGFEEAELNKNVLTNLPHSRIRIEGLGKNAFKLHSFCLMPNHFHLLIEQSKNIPISNLILKLCTSYAMYINRKYKRVGHLFQDQFKSKVINSNEQLMWTSAYIHTNPLKDGLVSNINDYKWSSYIDYTSDRNFILVYRQIIEELFDGNDFLDETINLSNDPM